MSKTPIEKTAQSSGSIFSPLLGLAKPLIKPAVKALATGELSAAAERALKKIFGKGFGPQEVQLYNLVQAMTPQQKKAVEKVLFSGLAGFRGSALIYRIYHCPSLVTVMVSDRVSRITGTHTTL